MNAGATAGAATNRRAATAHEMTDLILERSEAGESWGGDTSDDGDDFEGAQHRQRHPDEPREDREEQEQEGAVVGAGQDGAEVALTPGGRPDGEE